MKTLKSKIQAAIASDLKKRNRKSLQTQILAKVTEMKAIKGNGKAIIEAIGSELNQSGQPYQNVKNANEAASVLLSQLERILTPDIVNGNHTFVYKSDSLLLISIDGQFLEITGSDLKASILKMAQNAGIPAMFNGTTLAKLLIDGFITFWKKHDKGFNEKSNRLLD